MLDLVRKIRLGQHQPVGDRHLPDRFGVTFDLRQPVHRVDRCDNCSRTEVMAQNRISLEG